MDTTIQHKVTIKSINEYAQEALVKYIKDIMFKSTEYKEYIINTPISNHTEKYLYVAAAPSMLQNKILDLPATQILVTALGFSTQEPFIEQAPSPSTAGFDAVFSFVYTSLNVAVIGMSYTETDRLATLLYLSLMHDGLKGNSDLDIISIKPQQCSVPSPLSVDENGGYMSNITLQLQLEVTTYLEQVETAQANGLKLILINTTSNRHTDIDL